MATFKTTVMTLVALAAAAQVWAAEGQPNQTTQLAQAKDKLASKSIGTKGIQRGLLQIEQRKLQGLIDDLQSGKRVDPSAIDRALQDAEHDAR
ncbi:MAG: hypothetical protein HY270_11810 [Deltaproteobacteria bacterium]|nr:hypothetical protein [Deltaproteobacteria bacterium]